MKFAMYSCGCIGIPSSNKEKTLMVYDCRYDSREGDEYRIYYQDTRKTNFDMLSDEKNEKLIEEIGSLICEGYKFRKIKSLLRR